MSFAFSGFDWDAGNREKCRKHGVSLDEIEDLFSGTLAILPDVGHSQAETRFLGIGRNPEGRYVFIAFTIRESASETDILPISARNMHREEVEHYEQANS